MGRLKPTKMTGKFLLRTDRKSDKNGKYAIYIDYTLGTKHAKTNTDIWVEEKYWDATKREVSRKHPQSTRINHELQKKRQEIDNALYDYSQRNKGRITIETLRAIVQGRSIGKVADSETDREKHQHCTKSEERLSVITQQSITKMCELQYVAHTFFFFICLIVFKKMYLCRNKQSIRNDYRRDKKPN